MNKNNAPANNPTRFGARVSKTHSTFDIGEHRFETRLITVAEDRKLTRQQAALPKGAIDEDTGLPGDLSADQQEETVNIMCEIVCSLLAPRLKDQGQRDAITPEWVGENMTSNDFAPLMYFLRQGQPDPETAELDDIGDDSGGDPNADPQATTTG